MIRILTLFFCVHIWVTCNSQKQANIWYFGRHLGLDFSTATPTLLKDGQIHEDELANAESTATISDASGTLLFYTDGVHVWNKLQQLMPNGFGLFGSGTTTQTLIVPKPDGNLYYIFTASPEGSDDFGDYFPQANVGFHYSIIDMNLENGLGDVVEKNILLVNSTTEKIAGTFHANGKDIWVVMHEWGNDVFRSFLITANGIEPTSVVSRVGAKHGLSVNPAGAMDSEDAKGQMKLSPSGEKLALTLYQSKIVELFNFDNAVGVITEIARLSGFSEAPLYGVEFSSSSRFIYIGQVDKFVYQFDLLSENIYGSKVVLGVDFLLHDNPEQFQLAPDGKIYIAKYDMLFIGAIDFPDKAGKECKYEPAAIEIPVDSLRFCLSGLPNFISTYLYNPELYPPDPIFEMPDVFTPNGDDYNPSFVPIKMYNVKDIEMKIFNRWGQEVYASTDLEKAWDGGSVSAGIYYWKADYRGVNNKTYSQKGYVSLVRESVN